MTTKNLPALDDLARRIKEEHQACRDLARAYEMLPPTKRAKLFEGD